MASDWRFQLKPYWLFLPGSNNGIEKYNSIVDYLSFLEYEINSAKAEFEIIVESSGIIIDKERLNKPESFIFANL